jgi:hypothetical protein
MNNPKDFSRSQDFASSSRKQKLLRALCFLRSWFRRWTIVIYSSWDQSWQHSHLWSHFKPAVFNALYYLYSTLSGPDYSWNCSQGFLSSIQSNPCLSRGSSFFGHLKTMVRVKENRCPDWFCRQLSSQDLDDPAVWPDCHLRTTVLGPDLPILHFYDSI